MENLPDAMGTAATGGLLARAIEPPAGAHAMAGTGGHTQEESCLNCGTALMGPHCHDCGQRAHVHRTLSAFFHDLLHGVLHFEGKTWRTIPLLVWKPGRLTRDYIEGRRARYVSPIAMFLFVVFLSFALFNSLGGVHLGEGMEVDPSRSMARVRSALDTQIAEQEQARASAIEDREPVAEIDAELSRLRRDRNALASVSLPENIEELRGEGPGGSAVASGLNAVWRKARDNPALLIYKLQSNAYKFSWMLIPLSVPFVWLLFAFNRNFRGYDHTVFTTYSITFMIALVGLASLFGYFGYGLIAFLVVLYAPFHMYKQLRGTYGIGRFGAAWRMLALSLFAWIALGLFATVLTVMAA